jgi:hypothetical protein
MTDDELQHALSDSPALNGMTPIAIDALCLQAAQRLAELSREEGGRTEGGKVKAVRELGQKMNELKDELDKVRAASAQGMFDSGKLTAEAIADIEKLRRQRDVLLDQLDARIPSGSMIKAKLLTDEAENKKLRAELQEALDDANKLQHEGGKLVAEQLQKSIEAEKALWALLGATDAVAMQWLPRHTCRSSPQDGCECEYLRSAVRKAVEVLGDGYRTDLLFLTQPVHPGGLAPPEDQDLVFRLRKRADIRRQIPTRKSVQEGKQDRLADLLDEAASALEQLGAQVKK